MAKVAATQIPKTRSRTAAERAGDKARSTLMRARGDQPAPSRHATYLNLATFREFVTELLGENPGTARIARELKLGVGTVYNAQRGNPINGAFVGALKKKAAGTRFTVDALITADDSTEAAAA